VFIQAFLKFTAVLLPNLVRRLQSPKSLLKTLQSIWSRDL